MRTGTEVLSATDAGGRVALELRDPDGSTTTATYDHVIAATGYRVDLDRLGFLDPEVRARLDRVGGFPKVTPAFESSVPGLHFIGYPAAACFGPIMRFACGAEMTAQRLSRHLSRIGPRRRAAPLLRAAEPVPAARDGEPSGAL
jgi:pyruvate/2-oxoglutarate dehydrogenase complex dihydrolipoamide dehydrogenase (E3) component